LSHITTFKYGILAEPIPSK